MMLPGMEGKEEVHVPFQLSLASSVGAEPWSPSRSLRSHGTSLVQGGFLQLSGAQTAFLWLSTAV